MIWCGPCYGVGLIPGQGTSTYSTCGQKQKKWYMLILKCIKQKLKKPLSLLLSCFVTFCFTQMVNHCLFIFICLFIFFFFVIPLAYVNSWARDWIWAAAVTYAIAVAMLAPFFFFFFFFGLFRWNPSHVEVPRLGVKWELQLLAYTTATAMPDPSLVHSLHHNLWQRWILNLLSEARGQTHIFMDTGLVLNPLSHNGNSQCRVLNPPHHSRNSHYLLK